MKAIRRAVLLSCILTALAATACDRKPAAAKKTDPTELDAIAAIYEAGEYPTAVRQLTSYTGRYPQDGLAWTILGNAYEQQDADADAEAAYKRAIEVNPRSVEAITGMGILARKRGEDDRAMAYYQQAVAIDPNYAQAYSSMTTIALRKGDYQSAVKHGRRGAELDPTDPVVFANLAIAHHYAGNTAERDAAVARARSLGYRNMESLEGIISGEYEFPTAASTQPTGSGEGDDSEGAAGEDSTSPPDGQP